MFLTVLKICGTLFLKANRCIARRRVLMALHVIVGYGSAGRATASLLVERGHEVRVITRSGGPADAEVRHIRLDAADATVLTAAARGAAVIYNCASPA